jgi:ribonucleoside-triphosphate reductase
MTGKIEKIQKRDGTIVPFDKSKIRDAIFKALTVTGEGELKKANRLTERVVRILNRRFKKGEIPQVEQIQDIVEEVLVLESLVKTAKAYILYREQRRRIREAVKVSEEAVDRLDQYLEKLDWEVQENANMAFSLQGLNHYATAYIIKKYWLNKIYPKEIREAYESGDFHIHNLDTLGPYTYFGKEVVITKLSGEIKLISLQNLYETLLENEVILNEKDQAFAKYPKDLWVLDKHGWVKVTRMVRKKKNREMRFVKGEQGHSLIVTDNHPFIIKRGQKEIEIEAKEVREKKDLILSCHIPSLLLKEEGLFSKTHLYLAEELLKRGHKDFFLEGFEWQDFIQNWGGSLFVEGTLSTSNSANSLNNKLELSEDLGYLVGIFIAEGNYDGWRLHITCSEKEIIEKIKKTCAQLGVRIYVRNKEGKTKDISICCSTLKLLFEKIFEIKPLSKEKCLPPDILTYNLDFVKGVIAGIIDGDGTVETHKTAINIRLSSRTLLEQLSILLQFFGIVARDRVSTEDIGKKNFFQGREIIQNYPLYGLFFSKKEAIEIPSFKYQKAKPAKKHWRVEEYGWNRVLNNEKTTIPDEFIYDITTQSGTFLCNGIFAHNCVGWDLYDFLTKGFRGVPGKVETKPAKHFRAVLGQIVNFMYTLQGEAAGAIAFSNFDTLLAPFIRYDNLNYQQVKQALQEFLFNMAIPTRVGFQCISEDTEILTPEGWKSWDEVKVGDEIYTLNLQTKELEVKTVKHVFKRYYRGIMYRLKNRIQDQLISPEHKVLRRKFNTQNYTLEPIEKILTLKSPIIVPIAGKNPNPDLPIPDEQIKLMAWIIAEGSIEKPGKYKTSHRVSIYQSKRKHPENYQEIVNLLKHFNLSFTNHPVISLGEEVQRIRLNAESSRMIHRWFKTKETVHFIPEYLFKMSQRQSRIFIETYLKADGKENYKIATSHIDLLKELQRIIVNAGWAFTVRVQKPTNPRISKKPVFILGIIKHPETYISKIEKVKYQGMIWCPTTDNGTIICQRNGKVFITGNCPFTNITLDLKPSPVFAKQPVIIRGKPQEQIYEEFAEEMKIFNKALYEVYMEGDAKGRPFHFPIPTINITKDFPWEESSFNGIFEASAKYGTNYFANYINSEMRPEDVKSMCCRLRLDLTELYNRGGGGLFGAGAKTGSLGVVTINLPRIGYLSKTKKEFFERLTKVMDLAKESLEIKRKVLENYIEKGLYPYSKYYLQDIKKMRGRYWANHFSTIGLVGMNECLLNFMEEDIVSKRGRKFALEVLDFMRERLVKYQKETGNIYNLEATPAESTAYRLALKDKERYPDIITAGTKKVPYYTNSSQLPVNYANDIFEALKLQDEIQCKYTGGTVFHIFLGERMQDGEGVKRLVRKVFENFKLPYITITPTFSICPVHGYVSGEHFFCPKCTIKQPCEVYTRIVGYYRPVQQWNLGKQEEFKQRKEFKIKESTLIK